MLASPETSLNLLILFSTTRHTSSDVRPDLTRARSLLSHTQLRLHTSAELMCPAGGRHEHLRCQNDEARRRNGKQKQCRKKKPGGPRALSGTFHPSTLALQENTQCSTAGLCV